MVYDIDHDGTPELVQEMGAPNVRYASIIDPDASYSGSSRAGGSGQGLGPWTTVNVGELGLDFMNAFYDDANAKDCTHSDLRDCVTGAGNGCRDWLTWAAIQCFCETPCTPSPPPTPPPIACDALVENTGRCGPEHGDAMCK